MARLVELALVARNVTSIAKLLDAAAPRTCDAIWSALPLEGPAWHTKTAGNEVYTLLPAFAPHEPPQENGCIVPLPGDLLYFLLPAGTFPPTDVRWVDSSGTAGLACIASFYDRN